MTPGHQADLVMSRPQFLPHHVWVLSKPVCLSQVISLSLSLLSCQERTPFLPLVWFSVLSASQSETKEAAFS